MKKVYAFFTALLVAMLLIPWQLNAQVLLNENFDTLQSGVPTGWVAEGTYSNSWQSTSGSYAAGWENSNGLYFNCYSASSGKTAILKSPVVDLSSSTKDMILSFNLYDADEDDIKVYLSKDGGVTYEENLLLTCEKISGWQTIEIPLASYKTEQKVSIVWYGISSCGYSRPTIDNIMIAPAPTCAVAENLFVTEQDQEGALLNWKLAAGKGAFAENFALSVYEVGNDTAAVFSETLTVDDDIELEDDVYSYYVEELEPGTAYYFTVKGICGTEGDEAAIAKSAVFYTACNPSVLPLALDTVKDTELIPCWTMVNADYTGNTVYLNTNTTIFATPALNHAANDIEVTLRYAGTATGTGFYYGVASDASCADFDTLGYVAHTATYAEKKISVNTAGTKFGNKEDKLFVIRPDAYMLLYGINVHQKPCCPRVEQPMASAVDSASVSVSWLGTASSYDVVLKDTVLGTEIKRTVTTNPIVIDGLAPQTTYLVLVQAVCEGCDAASAMSDSIYVTTLCGVGEATFAESFEYKELGSVMPECWVQSKADAWIVNHNISYYDTPNSAANGYSAIYMHYYGVAQGQTATFSPQPFKVETAGQYDVKFAMYRYSKGYYGSEGDGTLTVWANNRPDTVGATKVCEIDRYFECAPVEKAAGWYYYDFNIPTVTGTVYLVFEGKSNATNNLYLDDISVYPSPTCRKVRNIELGTPTTTSVPIKWVAAEGTSQWIVDYVVLAGTDTITSDSILTSNNPFIVEGLATSSAYKIKGTVTTYCSATDLGEAISFEYDFQTACEAMSKFPYFEGFENAFPPICWEMKNTAGSSDFKWQQYSNSSYVKEGQYAAYWSYKSSGSKAILVTPEFAFPEAADYRIELYAYRGTSGSSYTGEGISVYLSDTKEVTTDAKLLAFIPRLTSESSETGVFPIGTVSASGMYQYKFDFNTSELSGKYVIFEALTNNGYYQSFDNLWIGPKPEVDVINSFNVDSVVVNAARLTIPDTLITSFDLVYGAVGFDLANVEETSIITVTGREYLFSALTPDTEYEVYVRARKGDKVSDWSRNPVKFRTLCAAFTVDADNFYVEDFESYEANVTDLGCLVQSYGGSANYRIATEMEYYDNSSYSYVKKYPSNGTKMAYLGSANNSWLFRAVQLKAGQNYSIGVDGLECSSYYEAKLSFGVATTPDRSAVTPCLEGYALPDRSDWERVTGYFTVPADGVYYVGVGIAYGGGTVGIDSLVIRTEACIPPAVTIAAISDTSVSFELQSDAHTWDFYYSTSNFDIDTINAELFTPIEKLTYTLAGLESNTTYYYAFRSNDEEGSASSWTPVSSFKTECGAIGLPVVLDFEGVNIDGCWVSKKEGSIYDGAISRRAYNNIEGSYSMMADEYNYVFISPRVDADLSNTQGSVWGLNYYDVASSPAYQVKMVVGVTNNPQTAKYFAVDTILVDVAQNARQTIAEYPFSFESLKENAEYKDAKYVVFEILDGAYGFIDYFNLDVIPTCPKPTEFEATAVTANSITLDWVAGGANETSWSVLVKQAADTVQTLVVNEHPFTVTGLTGNTTYSFELRALCAINDSSKVVELAGVKTDCDVYALPYENALNGMPACWTIEDDNVDDHWSWSSYNGLGYVSLSTTFADSYACDTARLYSAQFRFDKKYNLSIEMYTHYQAGTFNVLFDNGTTRDTLVANYQHHDAWDTVTIDMSAYQGQTGRIVFEGWGPTQTSYEAYWYLRNFAIVEQPAQYNVAGTAALTGFEWDVTKNTMTRTATGVHTLTFSNVPVGEHQLKVAKNAAWEESWGFTNLDNTNSSANIYNLGGNIAFILAATADVTVEFNPEANTVKVTTTGNFSEQKPARYVAGNSALCNGENWNPGAEVNKMTYDYVTGEYTKVFTNVAAGTYEFKVTQGDWDKAQFTNVDATCSDKGWEGGNGSNIKFTLRETATVTIKLTAAEKVCLTSTIGEFGKVEITSYTLVGDATIFGTAWDVANNDNNMVRKGETDTLTKVYTNILLTAKDYEYKVVGNHSYSAFEYPAQNAKFTIKEKGYYTVTFTFVAGNNPSIKADAVKYVAPAAPAKPTIQYGGGYFTADNLPVAVTTTETRPNYILVTIDGSEPSFEGVMTGATLPVPSGQQIPMTATTTIKVRGMLLTEAGQPYQNPDSTYVYGEVVSATFTKVTAPTAPEFTPAGGRYIDSVRVSISCATENVVIKYETAKYELGGATDPTGKSKTYTESFLITDIDTTIVSAVAYLTDAQGAPIMDVAGMPIASAITRAQYDVIPYVAPIAPGKPTIQYGGGFFTADNLPVAVTTTETRPNYILVTIDGSEPSFEGVMTGATAPVPSGTAIPMTATTIVKARVMLLTEAGQPYQTPKGEYIYSEVVSATFIKVAVPAAPVFTPAAGEYFDSVRVSIASATETVMIKYALGGSEPTGKSATYTESFLLTDTTIVSAVAYLTDAQGTPIMDVEGMPISSEAVFAEYKVAPYVAPAAPATPAIQYGGGYFIADNLPVALTTTETRPNYILVTIDGSEPSFEGVMTGATLPVPSGQQIPMTATTTIKVRGMLLTEAGQPYQTPKGEYIYSNVVSATFTKVAAPAAPEFTPAEGNYTDSVRVSIACATEDVMIKYELGGAEPTGKSATYTESFLLTDTTTVSAIAYLTDALGTPIMDVEGMPIASEVVFAEYLVEPHKGVDVDNVEVAAIVYAKDGMVYVDTEVGSMIEVFTVQGQRIYAAEATTQLTAIDAFAADIVLVRVNGEIIKVSVK